jgi:hypothetical protein
MLLCLSSQTHLMTAMLTGAKVLARYTVLSAIACVGEEKTVALEQSPESM